MSKHEKLEYLDDAIFELREAIKHLECTIDHADIAGYLKEHLRNLETERDSIHAEIEAQDARDDSDIMMDYWREAM